MAQALIHDPEVLLLDEPTTGLDPNQIVEIRELIKNIGREKTVIMSSHILAEIEATCDRVLIINKGKIVADGTSAELRNKSDKGKLLKICIQGGEDEDIYNELALIPELKTSFPPLRIILKSNVSGLLKLRKRFSIFVAKITGISAK